MIQYESGFLGLSSLTRVHGSAVYKTTVPAVLSTLFFLLWHLYATSARIILQPYAVGAFVSFFSFLLTFRLNYGYQRYWEGATAVHQMISKWIDCSVNLAAFHYQSTQYADIRPNALAETDRNNISGKSRQHFQSPSMEETVNLIEELFREQEQEEKMLKESGNWWARSRRNLTRTGSVDRVSQIHSVETDRLKPKSINLSDRRKSYATRKEHIRSKIPIPLRFQEQFTKTGGGKPKRGLGRQKGSFKNVTKEGRVPMPSLFLNEVVHLFSLLSAVAMSTLRNDMEFADSPLVEYFPGQPWPAVDPDSLSKEIQARYNYGNETFRALNFCLGLERSQQHRTLYNAARPFAVLGGVSDQEVALLQQARGPYAKVALVSMWLQEFISREYLAGSTGMVASPIISRLYQFLSDGMTGYNAARKVAYSPFPFPMGQTTTFFTMAILFVFPLLYASFVNRVWLGAALNFLSVLCFLGLHEVARELEDPFANTPNDLPLTTFQAEFNESLVTIYSGFHPDSWWDAGVKSDCSGSGEASERFTEDPHPLTLEEV